MMEGQSRPLALADQAVSRCNIALDKASEEKAIRFDGF
jgi:hypothetical protein